MTTYLIDGTLADWTHSGLSEDNLLFEKGTLNTTPSSHSYWAETLLYDTPTQSYYTLNFKIGDVGDNMQVEPQRTDNRSTGDLNGDGASNEFLLRDLDPNSPTAGLIYWYHFDVVTPHGQDFHTVFQNSDYSLNVNAHSLGAVGLDWHMTAVADFSGDGTDDFLMQRGGDYLLYTMAADGSAIAEAHMLATLGAPYVLSAVVDQNADGTADMNFTRLDQAGHGASLFVNAGHVYDVVIY